MGGAVRRRRVIDSADRARALFLPALRHARDERLYVAHLDAGRALIGIRVRFGASRASVELPMREIIADAVSLGTAGLVIAHNHPSGDPWPSMTDIRMTRSLIEIARRIGVGVHDHLVFSGELMVSFSEAGLL